MVEICSNCKNTLRPGSKFCGFCGTPVKNKERRCSKCNELLEDGERFCPMCGEKYTEAGDIFTPAPSFTSQKENLLTAGTLVSVSDTLRFSKGTSEEVKKAVRTLKKQVNNFLSNWGYELFLYNKDEEVVFLRRQNSPFIEGYRYSNTQVPFRKYTVSSEVDYVWRNSRHAQSFAYFFHNLDAFFAWDDYIFISVYEGKLAWTAADRRDTYYLPNKQSDVTIYLSGVPELEFLPNGNIRCQHFYDNAECKLVKGVLIPV